MISIITPTHKMTTLLDLTIGSVLMQTFKDYEWVVLDNSREGYFESYLDGFFERHPELSNERHHIRIVRKVYDRVCIGRMKNDLVRETRCGVCDYVLLLDHDDLLDINALQRINDMDIRYREASFITSDYIRLTYMDGLFYSTKYNINTDIGPYGADVVSGCLDLDCGFVKLDYGYLKNYTYRYYDIGVEYDKLRSNKIASHPRCIKKHVLLDPLYEFHEGHKYSEDIVQCFMLGCFLRGCYIEAPTVVNIDYDDKSNVHLNEMCEKESMDGIWEQQDCMDALWVAKEKLFKGYETRNRFLNIDAYKK